MATECLERRYETWIPASLESIDFVCSEVRGFLARLDLEAEFFGVSLVAREALVNAVVHGCGSDAKQRIRYAMVVEAGRLVMEIEDPGQGFDWQAQEKLEADLSDDHGRGLSIFHSYCSNCEYNAKGNKLRLIKVIDSMGGCYE